MTVRQKVTVRASLSCRRWLGGEQQMELPVEEEGLRVADLLSLLAERHPASRPLLAHRDEEALWAHVIPVQNGHMLRRDDVVSAGSEVELLPPIAGG
jgi:molybdopterin converting factor small subunit